MEEYEPTPKTQNGLHKKDTLNDNNDRDLAKELTDLIEDPSTVTKTWYQADCLAHRRSLRYGERGSIERTCYSPHFGKDLARLKRLASAASSLRAHMSNAHLLHNYGKPNALVVNNADTLLAEFTGGTTGNVEMMIGVGLVKDSDAVYQYLGDDQKPVALMKQDTASPSPD